MKKYISIFIKSLIAGILIAIGGSAMLSLFSSARHLSQLVFGIVILIAFIFELDLFNNKLADTFNNKPIFIIDLAVMLVGNVLGAFCTGKLLLLTGYGYWYNSFAERLTGIKFLNTYAGSFFLAVFCGMIMYFAYEGFKKAPDYFGKAVVVLLSCALFLFCKFDHAILDIFYFTVAKSWSVEAGLITLCVLAGNIVGTLLVAGLIKCTNLLKDKEEKIED